MFLCITRPVFCWPTPRILTGGSGRLHLIRHFRSASARPSSKGLDRLSRYSFWKNHYQGQLNKKINGYDQNTQFEWFTNSSSLLELINNHIEELERGKCGIMRERHISYVDLGCGTSRVSADVYLQFAKALHVVVSDFVSETVQFQREAMANLVPEHSGSTFQAVCADVLQLPFQENSFDIAFDKGTMDALLKDETHGKTKSVAMISEVQRILKPGGRYLQVSDEDPDIRLLFLEDICRKTYTKMREQAQGILTETSRKKNQHHLSPTHTSPQNPDFSNVDKNTSLFDSRTDEKTMDPMSISFQVIIDDQFDKEYFIYCLSMQEPD